MIYEKFAFGLPLQIPADEIQLHSIDLPKIVALFARLLTGAPADVHLESTTVAEEGS